jgi:hypothetical protein
MPYPQALFFVRQMSQSNQLLSLQTSPWCKAANLYNHVGDHIFNMLGEPRTEQNCGYES